MASPANDAIVVASGGYIAAGRYVMPDWAPVAGELKQISHAAGYFGTHGGATLAEIDPIYQTWHPLYGSGNSYSPPFGTGAAAWNSINAYCGMTLNTDARMYIGYGAGHSAVNVPAPYAFDLVELKWKWLDIPLPFDAYYGHGIYNQATAEAYYTNGEIYWEWGEIVGDSTTFGALARPGVRQPITGHSRSLNLCIPAAKAGNSKGKFFKFDSPIGNTGGVDYSYNSHLFNHDTATWSRTSNYSTIIGHGTGAAYDATTNKVIVFGKGGTYSGDFGVFDVATETWTTRTASNTKTTGTDQAGNAVHSASGLYIIPASRTSGGAWASPGNGVTYEFFAAPISNIVGTGSFSISTLTVDVVSTWPLMANGFNDYLGWSYCPADKCLYCLAPINGENKYWKLTPPTEAVTTNDYLTGTWVLTEEAFDVGTYVRSITYLDNYLRHQWDAKSRSFIWHSGGINDPVMAWRPAGI